MLGSDLALERGSQASLKEAIAHCEGANDYVSREILERHPRGHRGAHRLDRTQLELIDKVGVQNYLQSQMEGGPGS